MIAVAPQAAPELLLCGKCQRNADGTFTWILGLRDADGRPLRVVAEPNVHATHLIRRIARFAKLTERQFRMLIGPA